MKSQSRLVEIINENLFNTFQSIKEFKFNLFNFYWIGLREIGANKSLSIRFHIQTNGIFML